METQQNNSAKFAFFYMLSLVALIFMSQAAGMIIFQIINKNISDVINQNSGNYSPESLKYAISALLISAPIYFLTMRQISRSLYSGILDKDSGIRKWLSYFILFVSSVVMIVWLIMTINNFLDGELSLKFILKSITALVISGSIFSFYFYDSKREVIVNTKDKVIAIYLYSALAVVIAVFVASLFFVESPTETRNRKIDNAVLEDFNSIDGAINSYFLDKKTLPADLDVLKEDYPYITDKELAHPSTNEPYRYNVVEDKKYELCSTFLSDNTGDDSLENYYKDRWPHALGEQCLKQKIAGDALLEQKMYR
ncbi:MAG: hypothetical protein US83_C0008G0057 [Candidatus Falkowbacteria bacterium GW2011_GWC2_38_22]|uniref:DUF5671 domain-containing protein n=1 Tax=Candidatus Falkowbacteria bacterium GW2011_GWE1_38_31 TaxID=1618638 RepID=A0A0G0MYM2_9BACT|nr:MAG: hypothetical protein US73_C0006G0053 [Candidatus Falkowbacteria bacterium GW2011_GWF2_38_1205]KKQ61216.1 MAG: hypothetical protein US83_C0008G0057 [Candidatus Falkowbacteria bacterium GW2011_GWC2_38_22]KKQ63279.1 MAG: hypothetical protein US84_C0007G0021 [Candidatus Falkowbacteria bacterium GW2011_GWF1_38_22]KKQ65603.1 MAG: hypothetical protein US87_C0006G0053 [Candidatus Falkowbacteria bacterium GW2011_GWE2_38_254]KKQ70011.1 MAG: hypothetical protein US91_C0007G0021 [Candidatus Falkowb